LRENERLSRALREIRNIAAGPMWVGNENRIVKIAADALRGESEGR
jgi:hypothetical protein